MAENEFEKTVKLPAGGGQVPPSIPPIPPRPPSQVPEDKTVKLTPAEDKTVKLTATPSSTPTPPPIPAVIPPPILKQNVPPPAGAKKSKAVKVAAISLSVLVLLLGAGWYFAPQWLQKRAGQFAQDGKHSESAQQLKWALRLFPLKKEPLIVSLGKELRLSKDLAGSQSALEGLLNKVPDHFEALRELGQTLREQGQTQKAFDLFNKCAQLNPNDDEVLRWAGQLSFEMKNYQDSSSAYEKLSQTGKAGSNDLYQLGFSYFEVGKLEESKKAVESAWGMDKSLKGANALLGKIYFSQGLFAESASLYQQELALTPDNPAVMDSFAEASLQAGIALLDGKNLSGAVPFFEQALAVPSKYTGDLHYRLAAIFAQQKKKTDAFNHLKLAVESFPNLKIEARRNPAFRLYQKSPEFQKIVR